MNKLECAIQCLLYSHHNRLSVFPNIHIDPWGGSEVDALYLTNTNRAYFYEIKVSKSDFMADRKKRRHIELLNRSNNVFVKPKHFYYVCYGFEIEDTEIPEYAGLIYCNNNGLIFPAHKKAPILWKEPLDQNVLDFIYKKIKHRYLNMRHETGYQILRENRNKKRKLLEMG